MITTFSQGCIVASLSVLIIIGSVFFVRQNQTEQMGGRIATAKMLWLLYVIFVWFLLSPVLSFDESLLPPIRILFGVISILMWVRGLVELCMMYIFKNWRPPYGIAHDILCCLSLGLGMLWYLSGWTTFSQVDIWMIAMLSVVLLTFVLETYYAVIFYQIVGEHTTGEDGVWFANREDPRFRQVVRITALWNILLYIFLVLFLMIPILGLL